MLQTFSHCGKCASKFNELDIGHRQLATWRSHVSIISPQILGKDEVVVAKRGGEVPSENGMTDGH